VGDGDIAEKFVWPCRIKVISFVLGSGDDDEGAALMVPSFVSYHVQSSEICGRSQAPRSAKKSHRPQVSNDQEPKRMLYAILCYNDEDVVWSWSQEEEKKVMGRLAVVRDRLAKAGKLGPSLRLLPTTSATTLRKTKEAPLVIDGPFAETKEQLLGFYVIDVADLDEALEVAHELAAANPGGAYELRPIAVYNADEGRVAAA
jgi:hypothetical protein